MANNINYDKKIRSVWVKQKGRRYYAIRDVVLVLTKSKDVKNYIKVMRRRDDDLRKKWSRIAKPLKVETTSGAQMIKCADSAGIIRIMESIPNPAKPEAFRNWLKKTQRKKP